jgi:hypothetical protein
LFHSGLRKKPLACNLGKLLYLNPKSEIETGHLSQSLGHERIEKISTDHFGYASIFSIRFCSKILRHLAGLNFGFRVELSPFESAHNSPFELPPITLNYFTVFPRRMSDNQTFLPG